MYEAQRCHTTNAVCYLRHIITPIRNYYWEKYLIIIMWPDKVNEKTNLVDQRLENTVKMILLRKNHHLNILITLIKDRFWHGGSYKRRHLSCEHIATSLGNVNALISKLFPGNHCSNRKCKMVTKLLGTSHFSQLLRKTRACY